MQMLKMIFITRDKFGLKKITDFKTIKYLKYNNLKCIINSA